MVMRFASAEAMQAYEDETRRLRLAALRMGGLLADISEAAGVEPDHAYEPSETADEESVWNWIRTGDLCAAGLTE